MKMTMLVLAALIAIALLPGSALAAGLRPIRC